MAKETKKPLISPDNTLLEYKSVPKSRKQINHEYYQKNKEKRNNQEKERYLQKKEREQELLTKYYQASIRVLMPFKDYTKLNSEKRKLWVDFNWTLKDFNENMSDGTVDIISIMKLRESAENLINDYWEIAKNKVKKGKNWNSLSEEEKSKLIKYWTREKVRKEQDLVQKLAEYEKASEIHEKELELAKFHEEKGKIKCECYSCAESKSIQAKIKEKLFNDSEEKQETIKSECANCYEYKKIDSESGLCGKCSKEE